MRWFLILLTLSYTIAMCRAGGGRQARFLHDHVDMLEVNHFIADGYPSFAQLIMWDYNHGEWYVVAWATMKDSYIRQGHPEYSMEEHNRQIESIDRWCDGISDAKMRSESRERMTNKVKQFVGGRLYPQKNYKHDVYEVIAVFPDGIGRRVTAPVFRETYTTVDPETENRNILDQDLRRGLSQPWR